MSPEQFAAAKHALGFGTYRLARMLCTTPRTIQRWQAGNEPVPPLVAKLLPLMVSGRINPKDMEE